MQSSLIHGPYDTAQVAKAPHSPRPAAAGRFKNGRRHRGCSDGGAEPQTPKLGRFVRVPSAPAPRENSRFRANRKREHSWPTGVGNGAEMLGKVREACLRGTFCKTFLQVQLENQASMMITPGRPGRRASDDDWRTTGGIDIVKRGLLFKESYDASPALPGFSEPRIRALPPPKAAAAFCVAERITACKAAYQAEQFGTWWVKDQKKGPGNRQLHSA